MKNTIKLKNTVKLLGFVAIVAAIGFSFAACDGLDFDDLFGKDGKNTGGGRTLTITDIPSEYDGKYAMFQGIYDSPSGRAGLAGAQSINASTQVITLVRISDGKVSLPVWMPADDGSTSIIRYSGSDNVKGAIGIFNSATLNASGDDDIRPVFTINFDSIRFSNGSATKSCNDATDNSIIAGNGEGTLTVTDIPSEYDGKYALFSGQSYSYPSGFVSLIGIQGFNASTQVFTFPRISDGKVSLPVWMGADDGSTVVGYSGSDNVEGGIAIVDSATAKSDNIQPVVRIRFDSIQFSNGNATISWSDGDIVEPGSGGGEASGSDDVDGWSGSSDAQP